MQQTGIAPADAHGYIEDVIRLAKTRNGEIVSVITFGSATKAGFSESVSDVDLIVALADGVSRKTKQAISKRLAGLELKHDLQKLPGSSLKTVRMKVDKAAGQFKSYFVCYEMDFLAGNTAAVLDVHPFAESLLVYAHIPFANIVTSAQVVWGDDFLDEIRIPALSKAHLAKNCVSFLLLNAFAVAAYPLLPNATKYTMSVLK